MGQCLPTPPRAQSSEVGGHQSRGLTVPAKGNQRHLQLSLRQFAASLFCSLPGWSFSFISRLPHCRRAVIRAARACTFVPGEHHLQQTLTHSAMTLCPCHPSPFQYVHGFLLLPSL